MFTHSQRFFVVCCLLWLATSPLVKATPLSQKEATTHEQSLGNPEEAAVPTVAVAATDHQSATTLPPTWLALPFVVLLLMIATGPLLYEKFWHQNYHKVALALAVLVTDYYGFILEDWTRPLEALMEYVQFIALIAALYMASGGILITVNRRATPLLNLVFLFVGAVIANFIGTTGASMLLIRPYIRLNRGRIKVYHIVFFIFMVSNVGGALTPIGDPPLFLGFLSGVPFFWTLYYNWLPWLVVLSLLGAIFYYLDTHNKAVVGQPVAIDPKKPSIQIVGKHNFIWLAIIIGAVFIDPNIFTWVPALHYQGHAHSFVREVILLSVAGFSYYYANQHALKENEFSLAPLQEVAFLFIGIFGTMV
ncbi:MAG: sodium:proton antiporter, partial [Bacteroidota bacterium]